MIGKGATPSFFAIANDNYTLTIQVPNIFARALAKCGSCRPVSIGIKTYDDYIIIYIGIL